APADVIAKLVQLKQGTDLHTSTFNQIVAFEVARGGFLDRHVRHIRQVYRERRDVMLEALEQHLPPEVTWTEPHGGLFLWARLPHGLSAAKLLEAAIQQKVAFVPGSAFFAPGTAEPAEAARFMRLNFSNADPDRIREGIRRLGAVIREQLGRRELVPA
ncbi:MAG: PLP-dependent aminotransferase family protein, partial [Anaerolineales bacterium]|nr:PLP-dependent aminotransferase family protein [Anaerolineales bacterium]